MPLTAAHVLIKFSVLLCSHLPLRIRMGKACSFVATLIIFGISVQDVLNDATIAVERDKDVLDLFCGEAAIHRAAVASGLASTAFDKFRVPGITDSRRAADTEDMSIADGFMRALQLVLCLRKGGLLVMGPPCSSFVMLNAVNCKRNADNNYQGDVRYAPVQLGNLLATAAAFLMTVACLRGVEVLLENPPCSTIWKFPILKQVLDTFVQRSMNTPRCAWSTEPMGQRMLKRFKFACTGEWISGVHRKCRCPGQRHFKLTTCVWRNGKLRFTGKGHALKKSAAYPDALGMAIVNAWRQSGMALPSGQTSASCNWLDVCPGSRKPKPCTKARSGKGRKRAAACSSLLAWLHPSPGQAQTSSSSSPSWLTPSPVSSSSCTSCVRPMNSSAPAWLKPSPNST